MTSLRLRLLNSLRQNVKIYNVIMVGIAFMVFYTGFLPTNYITKIVIDSVKLEDPSFTGDGYISLAIIYAVCAVANWFAPSFISVTGPKYAIIIAFSTLSLYIVSFLKPITWALYTTSVLTGLGAACIWTALGTFITINSTEETRSRNSGLFWAMFEFSLLFGNLIVYFKFQGLTVIDSATRFAVFVEFLIIACCGILILFALRPPESSPADESSSTGSSKPIDALVDAFRLFKTKKMFILNIVFIFTGFELGFFSGVYGSAIGFNKQFGTQAKELVGLNGIFIGVGEITGGALFGIFGKWALKFGRDPAYLLGYLVHMLAYFLIFINLPQDSPMHETDGFSYIHSSAVLALFCSFLLGFGDGCFNPQIISLLGSLYPQNSAPAFAIFKFIQSIATAASFFYSQNLLLYQHLLILAITGTMSVFAFCTVEWKQYAVMRKVLNKENGNTSYGSNENNSYL